MSETLIVFLGGYANSGKTTAMRYLASQGLTCLSTSDILHKISTKVFPVNGRTKPQRRYLNILLAEDILKPYLGNNVFCNKIVEDVLDCDSDIIVIETIGGDEYRSIKSRLKDSFSLFLNINLRSVNEQPEVDSRQLLPFATDVYMEDVTDNRLLKIEKLINNY